MATEVLTTPWDCVLGKLLMLLFSWGGWVPASAFGLTARLRYSIVAYTLTRSPGFPRECELVV